MELDHQLLQLDLGASDSLKPNDPTPEMCKMPWIYVRDWRYTFFFFFQIIGRTASVE
jgi:hypothetical protein